jgi:neutral ceramidase
MGSLLAGAAKADITPPPGVMMDGYGARQTPSEGIHDPLFARVLVLDDGVSRAALIGCDLLGMHPWITREVRRRAAADSSTSPDAVMVASTHNHAGPAGLREGMFARLDEKLAQSLVAGICQAIHDASTSLTQVTVKVGQSTVDTVPMNRRDPSGPSDSTLRVVLFESESGPLACLLSYACHATALNAANLQLSAEFPGVACRIVEQATGAMPVYLNGACGDVNPAWIEQDFASVERAGQAVGGTAVRLIADLQGAGGRLRAHNIRWDEFLPLDSPGRVVASRLTYARADIDLPLRPFAEDAAYAERIEQAQDEAARHQQGSEARRSGEAALSRWNAERWAAAWSRRSGETGVRRTQIQAIGLGRGLAILALPGEFFAQTGALLREAAGIEDLLVACYANDYVGYVVPEEAYDQGGYETGVTFFAPEAEAIIRGTAVNMLQRLTA